MTRNNKCCSLPAIKQQLDDTWKEIKYVCKETPTSKACVAAWDKYWDLEHAYNTKKEAQIKDPLEIFCNKNPNAHECRIYDL